ncbi:hypothetical protein C1878_07185 [Gordonibacter sp. 28C]|uniref:UDP-3-O-(3-hydroxymyristoyl)glucosamine N-acyltransferase n=1 Tax=Gordonibacter sp. 28C TaxID=2078569 RepID=UPI000DF858C4|nr:UDP-3-O-(3-hydroxymyristoyl)glucosamine N-acyltransferase [Gordonibacter sp. 28C]RDB62805.1 hypothetical protein C1878_07185 [Gordonibacter sp. 28C]
MKRMEIGEIVDGLRKAGFSCEFRGSDDCSIEGFSDPASYLPGTAVWLGATRYLKLDESEWNQVTLLFARPDMEGAEKFPSVLYCEDPRNAFMFVVEGCVERKPRSGIHPAAVVSDEAVLGAGVSVGAGSVVEAGVSIGDGTVVQENAVIHSGTVIGSNCRIMDGVCIGNDGFGFRRNDEGGWTRLPHLGRVVIGDDVEIGDCSNVDRGTFRDTVVGNGTKIDALCHVGHNVQIGRDCLLTYTEIGGNAVIGDRCVFVSSCVKNRIAIGSDVYAGIGSVVIKNLPDGVECFGNPARIVKKGR